jgi:hypothetical protein
MVSTSASRFDQVLAPRQSSSDPIAEDKVFVSWLVQAGQIRIKPSLSENRVRVWIGSEIRDGHEDFARRVLKAIHAASFGAASESAEMIVFDAENPSLELGRFSWVGGLQPI